MRSQVRTARAVAAIFFGLAVAVAIPAQTVRAQDAPDRPWLDTTQTPEHRADALVARLVTTDQKLTALSAGGLRAYGIVEPNGSDGPAGPTQTPGAFSLPAPLALAAGFDRDLARDYGAAVARQFRAAGKQRMLGPTLDIARTWQAGRIPEAYGEDPFLSGAIAASFVRAAQAGGVGVTLKHYAVYGQEQGRTGDPPFGLHLSGDNIVSERTIREIYLPAFGAAVREGGALNAMCAFPRVNGTYACENPFLLGVLKGEFGLRGTVSPDFPDGQRTVIEAVNAGLDNGNFGLPPADRPPSRPPGGGPPGGGPPGGAPPGAGLGALFGAGVPGGVDLKTAVQQGKVTTARLDDMIRRRLISMFAVGSGVSPSQPVGEFDDGQTRALALRAAETGAVLLRNQRGVLPLARSVRSIAVIGVQAGARASAATTGSAYVEPSRLITALDAIKRRAGAVKVTYARGSAGLDALPLVPTGVLRTPSGQPGLQAVYYPNANLKADGEPFAQAVEPGVDLPGPPKLEGLPANNGWSAIWTGTLTPRKSGLHDFTIQGGGSGRLYLDGVLAARFDRVDFGTVAHATARLTAGKPVKLRIEYTPRESAPIPAFPLLGTTLGVVMKFGWQEPDDRIAEAVAAAKRADVAVVFAADRHGEGADRSSLNLPGDQDALIAAVAAANPKTVVVLSTGGPVAMPWATKVSAIVEMWYSGDMFGEAASRILFGDAAPQGRLPITFPKDQTQGPGVAARDYPGLPAPDGAIDKTYFDEGLLVGYRWWDGRKQKPLYPFGYGQTYSPMKLGDVAVAARGKTVRVTGKVRNLGARADSEVVEVYVGFPAAAGEPPKRLAGFQRIAVAPHGSGRVDIILPASAFELWDEKAKGWSSPHGRYRVMVGRSSREIDFEHAVTR